jgi:radical SAM protein (TIGR01212 family)
MYYYSLDEYLKKTFGVKTYKLALSSGCSCPNRDGTTGYGGCIFCSEKGSGDFASDEHDSVSRQIEEAKRKIAAKTGANSYIAYFQSFTNTYGPVERLEPLFREAISHPEVVALSLATRPDCLSDEMYELLRDLATEKPVWIELGLQTVHDGTAEWIRRGFGLPCFLEAMKRLHSIGVQVIVHLILGLPGETLEDMLESIDFVGRIKADGVKLQLLHVLAGSDLANLYKEGTFETLSLNQYIDILCSCVERLPRNIPIHRLTGDGPKALLISPLWSANKRMVRNTIDRTFRERDIEQGRYSIQSR